MAKVLDKETGEVKEIKFRGLHKSVGFDFSKNIIQNHDFQWDNDLRDFKVVETDKEDREAYIQSFAKETGVYNIMKMYAKTGDTSVLNKKSGFYGDISNIPVDELNPAKRTAVAEKAVKDLSKALGVDLTSDQLASMSSEELVKLVVDATAAIQAKKAQKVETEKKEGDK